MFMYCRDVLFVFYFSISGAICIDKCSETLVSSNIQFVCVILMFYCRPVISEALMYFLKRCIFLLLRDKTAVLQALAYTVNHVSLILFYYVNQCALFKIFLITSFFCFFFYIGPNIGRLWFSR